ncbi:hypothetical protein Ahy_A03g014060 [Arachis hypogaea]|uniref:Uncharacterized protein n=1 Tax=Arachis hypogaea TaxID=3818 RepID=A0A445DWW1_ARAHY|nr:hypothetical protein Ahy_A03g014060 [Arachis hypogaea]
MASPVLGPSLPSEHNRLIGCPILSVCRAISVLESIAATVVTSSAAFLKWSMVPLMAGSLDAAINTFKHEGQVRMLETSIESTLEESDLEKREIRELLEMKVAMKLGRSVSQLRELASKSASYRMEGG